MLTAGGGVRSFFALPAEIFFFDETVRLTGIFFA